MKFLTAALLLSLSACGTAPALAAADCRSTAEAMAYANSTGIRPTIVRGVNMAPFIAAAREVQAIDLKTISFVAIVSTPEGAMAFYGNFSQVCGPLMLSRQHVNIMLRPT